MDLPPRQHGQRGRREGCSHGDSKDGRGGQCRATPSADGAIRPAPSICFEGLNMAAVEKLRFIVAVVAKNQVRVFHHDPKPVRLLNRWAVAPRVMAFEGYSWTAPISPHVSRS